ncbi:MAG: cation:dicarboxylase symporter family transporter [Proteobacteria bacterium]|nr:cation:dicarboxylase symporter family transporter [Pseudomonadota bacterium]
MFGSRHGHRHGWITLQGFLGLKLAACLMGVVATTVLLDLPWVAGPVGGPASGLLQPLKEASWNFVVNPLYWGIYLAILTGRLARDSERLTSLLDKGALAIEKLGERIEPFIPVFLLATGIYIVSLPEAITAGAGDGVAVMLAPFNVWGLSFDPTSPAGMMWVYIYGSVLVALVCWVWHLLLLLSTTLIEPRFRISHYFTRYWNTVYALLWSTSSERLAQPLSLHRAKVVAPWVPGPLRRLVIGLGTSMNINGTIICVFVLAGVVGRVVGADMSFVHLLIAVPMVYMISLAAPGIPGELVLFAGPLVAAVGMEPAQAAPFLGLYLGLQLGLPDSFRTGTNSTDDLLCAVAFNALAERAGVNGRRLEGQHRTAA